MTTTKLDVGDLRGVAETLMIPLAYRDDALSRRFRDAIDYDWHKFPNTGLAHASIMARTQILDQLVGAFAAEHPAGLVVNMGAGLDTRFHRLDNGAIRWLEVDLPEVIAFRAKLGEPAEPRHALFAGSILETTWLDEARQRSSPAILFVAEGLLPYFSEAEHRQIFATLAEGFPGEEIAFHTIAPSILAQLGDKSALTKMRTSSEMRWGLEEARDIEQLDPRVRFVREYPLMPAPLDKAAKIVHARFV
ncbi:MAG TPA: class I SAM-dependent methyltransferase [Kofleriaceae bacterium]|jgi:O-methyltransferase involved in polyketide biosynthesis